MLCDVVDLHALGYEFVLCPSTAPEELHLSDCQQSNNLNCVEIKVLKVVYHRW
jgi:hypothetical protein